MVTDDHAVVGAGLGGLTAGALLANAGNQVRVLEAHQQPGGCATTFQRFDTEIEVSLHELDGLDEYDLKTTVFEELDVFDHVEFEEVPHLYRYVDRSNDVDISISHGKEDIIEDFSHAFPEEREGIEQFVDTIISIRHQIAEWPFFTEPSLVDYARAPFRQRTLGRYRNTTVGEALDKWIDDEQCKLALLANIGYYHDNPYELSLPFYAVSQGGYIEGGSYYIRGGSQRLADHLTTYIENRGGTVECDRLVSDITVQKGRVSGVTHAQTYTGNDQRTTPTSSVIANAAIPNVADELLPSPYSGRLANQISEYELAPSLSTLYLVFEPPVSEVGNEYYSTVIESDGIETLDDLAKAGSRGFGNRRLTFVDYSQVTANLAPNEMSVGAISVLDYESEWSGLKKPEYNEKKERVTSVLVRRLDEVIPGVADVVTHRELATPKTIKRFTRNPSGTAYGFAQKPGQDLGNRDIQPPVDGLTFASAWSNPGGGFSGAILGGAKTATSLSKLSL